MKEKDESVSHLLDHLSLEKRSWETVDNWHGDLCAVGVQRKGNPRRLVYISTFDLPPGWYFCECEVATGSGPTEFSVTRTEERIDLEALERVLEMHLDRPFHVSE